MAKFVGTVSITDLPPNRGMIAQLCFFGVDDPDTPPPFDGDPPIEALVDCVTVVNNADLDVERKEPEVEHQFVVEHSPGYYYVQLRVKLFRMHEGEVYIQLEPYFYAQRPLHITDPPEGMATFPASWPSQSIEQLQHYETIEPPRKRPWWRLW